MLSIALGFLIVFSSVQALAIEKEEIDSIFKVKCMDCHSDKTVFPWYSNLPIAKDLIKSDIEKGKTYFEIERDFLNYSDLESLPLHVIKRLEYQVVHDEMPPSLYRFAHWDKIFTKKEKQKILDFLEQQKELKN